VFQLYGAALAQIETLVVLLVGEFTVTTTGDEVADVHPFSSVTDTEYDPAALALILCVVAPVFHTLPVVALDVSVTLPPAQKVVAPPALIVGADGD